MGKAELVDKILGDGRDRAAQVDAERDRAVAAIRARLADEVRRLEAESAERVRRDTGVILERARSSARIKRRNALLQARWQVLDQVIEQAGAKLLTDPGYPELVAGLVRRHAVQNAEVHLSEADTRRFGRELGFKVGAPVPIDGGAVIKTGRQELNFALADALSSVREDLAAELSASLFPS
jgi:V/A-type H+-transporting ATPase subunit E